MWLVLQAQSFFKWFFKKVITLFIYLFLAVLGLCYCTGFSLVPASQGFSLAAMCELFIAWLLLWSLGPGALGLSGCGSWALEHRASRGGAQAYLFHDTRDPPGSGINPRRFHCGFSTSETPEKPRKCSLCTMAFLYLCFVLLFVTFRFYDNFKLISPRTALELP